MSRYRILYVTKSRRKAKDSSKRWVGMRDPETRAEDAPHYDISCFPLFDDDEKSPHYKTFFQHNNKLVDLAFQYEVDLGEDYDKFFELGMRLSQQFEGPLRDRTEEQYNRSRENLKNSLLEKTRARFQERERQAYQEILDDLERYGILEKDLPAFMEVVDGLREIKIPEEISGRGVYRHMGDRIGYMGYPLKTDYLQYLPQIPAETRVAFIDLITHHRRGLTLDDDGLLCFADEIASILDLVGSEDGLTYLDFLKQNITNNGLYDYINSLRKSIEKAPPEKRDAFFQTWRDTKDLDESLLALIRISNKPEPHQEKFPH